jgi:hypothetical protein
MKKQLLTLLAAGTISSAFAQLPVSTTGQKKHIVLEEFTGIYCGYCPDGHQIANSIYNANPGTVLINIHTGGYAKPSASPDIDLRSTIGDAIVAQPGMGLTGYPEGDVNRTVFTGTAMAMDRGTWSAKGTTIKGQAAYCNVAVQGNVNSVTRVLTYTAQVYYTANSPASTNSLTVVLLEDKVVGPQHNYGTPWYNLANYNVSTDQNTYNHNHVLRAGLTAGNFGITIPTTTSGTTFTTTGSYTIPSTYGATGYTNPCKLANISLAAFVTETKAITINGASGPISIDAATNIINNNVSSVDAFVYPNPATNNATIELNLTKEETVTVNVLSVMGQVIYSKTLTNVSAGLQTIDLNCENWSNGIYNINITTSNGNVSRKLEINK